MQLFFSVHEWYTAIFGFQSFEKRFSHKKRMRVCKETIRDLDKIYPFFYFQCYLHCNLVHLHTERPTRLRPSPATCYDCKGLDFKHDARHTPQVGQSCFTVGKDEAKISQQVCSEEKELHFSHSLPQTESRSASEGDQGAGGAPSSLQKALCNRQSGFKEILQQV